MSRGTRKAVVRIATDLLQEIQETIGRRNQWVGRYPWTLSDFLRIALREKIEKMRRSRGDRVRCHTPSAICRDPRQREPSSCRA